MVVPIAFGWRHLLFANWPVDADALADHLPPRLAVQEYDGAGWLSVVPLVNVRLRPRGFPGWAGISLPEVNLRTYVTCDGEPGVYFFSLDADGPASVLGARLLHRLPYFYARASLERVDGRVRFESRRRHPGARAAEFVATYGPTGEPFEAEPGSRAEYLTERRRLFAEASDGRICYTDVAHEPYPLYEAEVSIEANTLHRASGFADPEDEFTLYYSPGVDVVTSRSKRWE